MKKNNKCIVSTVVLSAVLGMSSKFAVAEEELGKQVHSEADEVESEANQIIDTVKQRLDQETEEKEAQEKALQPGDVQVNHVPEFIKDEIKQELRGEIRDQVLEDLIEHAKTQRWGLPDAQPEWFSRISLKGDIRVRGQSDMFGDDNVRPTNELPVGYVDFMKINEKGGITYTDIDERFLNTWEDRQRMRLRARLTLDAKVTTSTKASFRISTGNTKDPVSTNQTLGQYGNRYGVVWDRAYLEYKGPLSAEHPWLKLSAGRMPNPFFATDLIWDSDLSFEGVASSFTFNLRGSDSLLDITQNDRTVFFTMGAFPLQEVELSSRDKWLFGGQLGTHWIFENQSSFKIGVAYYDFTNIQGEKNSPDDDTLDYTAPQYLQKGNLMFNIRNEILDPAAELWALAADYNELALTMAFDYASLAPIHIVLTGEAVQNVGYDKTDIQRRTQGSNVQRSGGFTKSDKFEENTLGYNVQLMVGWPKLTLPGNWRASLTYRRVEADAVLDAFTDSDFHLGGTDAEGWIAEYDRGIGENIWLTLKYLSANEITSLPFSVDTFQLDVNAKF